ncbi:hypothetical protein HQ865_05020 [Mucilaginibacter mali]|uniref:Outer membrane protein beta-barrel domain-containing protein n=1 Tax=Mucilaginibacter mali TaxID=2740462 RepID=A0A7D4UJH3_9SPHI|nr:hypothetical protein [Mucilaginibacter mali]QKJ29142.1 hypothetical protein HQ865_05020 [Mucilaginibacter mali]
MDEEEIYDKLSDRIREVFDNYDEDTMADEGWALLRQKFPEEEKRRGLAWLWYAAAAVVLLCLGLWFRYQPGNDANKLMVKNPKTIIKNAAKERNHMDTIVTANATATDNLAQNHTQQSKPTTTNTQTTPILKSAGQQTNALTSVAKPKSTTPAASAQQQNAAVNTNTGLPVIAVIPPKTNGKDTIINKVNTKDIIANNTITQKQADTSVQHNNPYIAANKPIDAGKPSSADALNKLLSEKTPATKVNAKQDKATGKKAVLSVFAATYFNYAKGSDNNINVGAGFGSDFRISKKLKLSTGVSIAQNSLNYTGGVPAYSGSGYRATGLTADPASNALNNAAYNISAGAGLASVLTPIFKNYTASLIGLDVPINLKYQFNPQKSDTYVSAGLSSGTFINETYVLNYTSAQLEQKSTTHGSFNNFDFAKTLNVSFGIGYPLGKSNRLIIEPFLKYPLDGLGMQQIKFGAGGVNLKLNFVPAKK